MGWASAEWSTGKCEICHMDEKNRLKVVVPKGIIECFTESGNDYIWMCEECVLPFLNSVKELIKPR